MRYFDFVSFGKFFFDGGESGISIYRDPKYGKNRILKHTKEQKAFVEQFVLAVNSQTVLSWERRMLQLLIKGVAKKGTKMSEGVYAGSSRLCAEKMGTQGLSEALESSSSSDWSEVCCERPPDFSKAKYKSIYFINKCMIRM